MATPIWLVAPYVSVLVICKWAPVARHVATHTAWTLPLGWTAVLALFGAVLGLWSLPLPAVAVCAALSGFAMITGRIGPGGEGPRGDDDAPSPVDWDEFDVARRRWERTPRGGGSRPPAGVA